ncbi:MAG: DUF1015 domain-containing protein [Chloroflexota bacterium]|nr:DUF1015 domain-containing protein [Chloroflexota bacterium]
MATIKSFRGTRYNPDRIDGMSSVISQPYDRVRHGLQEKYYERSPYNVVRIIKGKERPEDGEQHNVYTRAKEYYESWLEDGILMREEVPALYVLRQSFTLPDGTEKMRQGLIAALELVPFDEGTVLPHERTHSGPKVDRLNLMRATEVNFGHIFMLYPGDRINELLKEAVKKADGFEAQELFEKDVAQEFWPVTDPEIIEAVREEMAPKRNLIIADGHHRYETALNYRDEMREKHPDAPANAGFNYRMVTFVSMEDPGLVILPTHRLIFSYGKMSGSEILEEATETFRTIPVDAREELEAAMDEATPDHPRFGFYDGSYTVLELKDPDVMDRLLPGRDPAWRMLDVTVLHELLIQRVMGISEEAVERKENIEYLRDPQMGYDAVDAGEAELLFILNPTRMEQVRACTAAGEKMPQKSTDFYPKVISGLVMMPIGVDERL